MMMIALADWILGIYAYWFVMDTTRDYSYEVCLIAGIVFEIGLTLIISTIAYISLAVQWEGYYHHRLLQFIHTLTLIWISLIPYGSFFLHLGYRQKGYRVKGLTESFPDGFLLSRDKHNYQGYTNDSCRGGFFYFMSLGFLRCGI